MPGFLGSTINGLLNVSIADIGNIRGPLNAQHLEEIARQIIATGGAVEGIFLVMRSTRDAT